MHNVQCLVHCGAGKNDDAAFLFLSPLTIRWHILILSGSEVWWRLENIGIIFFFMNIHMLTIRWHMLILHLAVPWLSLLSGSGVSRRFENIFYIIFYENIHLYHIRSAYMLIYHLTVPCFGEGKRNNCAHFLILPIWPCSGMLMYQFISHFS